MSAAKALNSDVNPQALPEARPAEPSMDDILASIRRIIADDQSRHSATTLPSLKPPPANARPAAGASPLRSPGMAPPASRQEPSLSATRNGAASRSLPAVNGSAVAAPAAPVPHVNPPPLPPTAAVGDALIEEIANVGVAAALRPVPETKPAEPPAATAQDASADAKSALVEDTVARAETSTEPAGASGMNGSHAAVPTEAAASPVIEIQPAEPAAATVEAPAPGDAPLVSPEAGATIGTSFSALETSIFMQNHGLVESLARDMLRPMLKSWLDDNLPAIVERLVRIEIERVARGDRA